VHITSNVCLIIDENGENYVAWDNKGTNYSLILEEISLKLMKEDNRLLLFLQEFRDRLVGGEYGMEICENNDDQQIKLYDGKSDEFWQRVKTKFNVKIDRKLHIYTYGTTYLFESPRGCQKVYNAAVLRGNHKKHSREFKALVKMRGTDLQIQQEVRECPIFCEFMENIIADIESSNFHTVAIVCRAGHHRSVACTEMLVHLYTNIIVDHLTIKN
jgi:hypothetical protein